MNINLTLIVQIFNFLIAYLILSKLLFKPILVILKLESFEKENLEQEIIKEEKNLLYEQEIKKKQEFKAFNYYKNNKPQTEVALVVSVPDSTSIDSYKNVDENQKYKAIKEVVSSIKLKVIND